MKMQTKEAYFPLLPLQIGRSRQRKTGSSAKGNVYTPFNSAYMLGYQRLYAEQNYLTQNNPAGKAQNPRDTILPPEGLVRKLLQESITSKAVPGLYSTMVPFAEAARKRDEPTGLRYFGEKYFLRQERLTGEQQLPQARVSYEKTLESIGIMPVEQTPLEDRVLTKWNDGTPSTLLANQQKPEPAMDTRRKQKAMETIVLTQNTNKAEPKGYAKLTAANIYRN